MRKFIKKTLLFLFLSFILVEGAYLFIIATEIYLKDFPGNEIYYSIKKSKKVSDKKILLLGDSVGNQIFPNTKEYSFINSLTCNQAISMAGHYILLNNYLKSGNRIDKLFILFTPMSFRNNLHSKYTYHYFLKPFYNSEFRTLLTETVKKQVNKIPFSSFVELPHILGSTWSPDFEPTDSGKAYTFLSPISVEYLTLIKDLSSEYNFEVEIMPAPVSVVKKDVIGKMDKQEISKFNFEDEFDDFFDDLKFTDSTLFIDDNVHLKNPEKFQEFYLEKMVAGAPE